LHKFVWVQFPIFVVTADVTVDVDERRNCFSVSPDDLAQQLTQQLGADVAQGIARNYRWFAKRPNTSLLTGSTLELASELRAKPRSVAEWAAIELRSSGL
jgi:hypothetical protein